MNSTRTLPKLVTYKTVILGHYNSGKTSIIQRFILNKFNPHEEPTIGAAFLTKTITHPHNNIKHKYEIWDTAGQERYRSLIPMYYRGAHVALIVFDVTNPDSFKDAMSWINILENEDFIKILIGNKSDLLDERKISRDEAIEVSNKYNVIYYDCSAKTGYGVDDVFECIREVVVKGDVHDEDKLIGMGKKKKFENFCCGL
ncbi:Vacuolar protein sorting-associated protein 21 [Cucumispora dikerogammari]|nr:Vacuolar protein sorting-associated protein 21 [Cucumispora dikerogammari]